MKQHKDQIRGRIELDVISALFCFFRGCGNLLGDVSCHLPPRLKQRRLGAHTAQVKVRYGDFTTLTRQITVEDPLTEGTDIYRLGCFLLGREKLVSRLLRLLGLGVANLREPTGKQLIFALTAN